MQQKYAYAFNGIFNWFRGLIPLPMSSTQRFVNPYYKPELNFIWRNHVADGYKIGQAYTQQPLDLSNYLLIRTRENLLL